MSLKHVMSSEYEWKLFSNRIFLVFRVFARRKNFVLENIPGNFLTKYCNLNLTSLVTSNKTKLTQVQTVIP